MRKRADDTFTPAVLRSFYTPEDWRVIDEIAAGRPVRNPMRILREIDLAAAARARAAQGGAPTPPATDTKPSAE